MQKPSLLAALLCCLTCAQAAEPSSHPPAPHPLTGKWTWTLTEKACRETWHYRANGTRSTSSGEETSQSRYEVPALPSLLGFYRVTQTITESNGKPDCSGDRHEADGQPVTRFIQLSPRHDRLIVCKEESLKACFGPLKRVAE